MKKEQPSRGSDTLLEAQVLDPDDLKQLHKTLTRVDAKLLDWSCRGQPEPDWLNGAVDVSIKALPELVGELARMSGMNLRLDGFPIGFPDPDRFLLRFRN